MQLESSKIAPPSNVKTLFGFLIFQKLGRFLFHSTTVFEDFAISWSKDEVGFSATNEIYFWKFKIKILAWSQLCLAGISTCKKIHHACQKRARSNLENCTWIYFWRHIFSPFSPIARRIWNLSLIECQFTFWSFSNLKQSLRWILINSQHHKWILSFSF